ncbi:hypothetical protein TNCT_466831 [Trichonephila clavata]|uniref:Uncharacterized protein n=1 Tax=Trichonephila clavata TaxID=2740835 RepID=A0A8X6JVL3_TRICU|nr:hypothetical protein TNCT_466831 [Trichonephila clavata]
MISSGNHTPYLVSLLDFDLDMAHDQQLNIDLSPTSPCITSSIITTPILCEELATMKEYFRRLQIICSEKEKTISLLRLDHGHSEDDTLYQLAWNEYKDIQGTLQQAVSDFDSPPLVPSPAAQFIIPQKYSH